MKTTNKGQAFQESFLDALYSFGEKTRGEFSTASIFLLIRKLRNNLHISQAQLAERTGLPQSHIAKIESGKTDAQLQTIKKILDALNCDMLVLPKPRMRFNEMIAQQAQDLAQWRVSTRYGNDGPGTAKTG